VHPRVAQPTRAARREHSGVGIAAFVIALITMFAAMAATPFGLIVLVLAPHPLDPTTDAGKLIYGVIGAVVAMDLIATGLAVAGLRQEDSSRAFPVIAFVLAGLTIVSIAAIILFVAFLYQQ